MRKWDELIPAAVVDSVRKHWSGHDLQWAAKEVGLAEAYGTMYRRTSAFVHGSDVSTHIFGKQGTELPVLKLSPGDAELDAVIPAAMDLMYIMATRANEAFGLGEEKAVEKIVAELRRFVNDKTPSQ